MKRTVKRRLVIDRETARTLVVPPAELRNVRGREGPPNTSATTTQQSITIGDTLCT
jgi:hypothetical protein